MTNRIAALLFTLAFCVAASAIAAADKTRLSPEEFVARHLQSVGSVESLAARKSTVAEGTADMRFIQTGVGTLNGQALFYSAGNRYRISLKFPSNKYQGEDIVFDGSKFSVGNAVTEGRSPLGEFLYTFNGIVKEGLLGGVLSTAWPLLNVAERKPRLEHKGTTALDGKQYHELSYRMRRGGGGVSIALYFDPDTFRHLRTIYKMRVPGDLSRGVSDSSSIESYYTIEEKFDGFQEFGQLQLPTQWNLRLNISGGSSLLWEWHVNYSKVNLNQPVGQ
jgi:hypothetical protein